MAQIELGIVGTGFIADNLVKSLTHRDGISVSRILTRRALDHISGFPEGTLTNSIDDAVSNCDVIVECSGDPIWATDVIHDSVEANRPVVTMNTEFHITTGSWFVGRGLVTEAEGDQPGCLAALAEDAVSMGFSPVAYGNMKGFLNLDPTPEDMAFWGAKQGISTPMVTSFTDGTKVQAEQILVGNFSAATIDDRGMRGAAVGNIEEAAEALVQAHERVGRPIVDFVVGSSLPHGVFLVATHADDQAAALSYYKLGEGPFYTIVKNNIFVHLEIVKTVRRIVDNGGVLLDNSARPELSLAAVAKRDLEPGETIDSGIGSFELRGKAVRIDDEANHLPIGLIASATVERPVQQGQTITNGDVSIPDSRASSIWSQLIQGRSEGSAVGS